MATKVHMEALSPTMEEGRLVKWAKQEGDAIKNGDTLAEVETDKAVMELVARADGRLLKIVVPEGKTVPVGDVVAFIGAEGEAVEGAEPANQEPSRETKAEPETEPEPEPEPKRKREPARGEAPATAPSSAAPAATSRPASRPASPAPAPADATRVKASPLARRLAEERGVDLRLVQGSGPGGRVIMRDVEAGAARASATPRSSQVAAHPAPAARPGVAYEDVPLTQIRKTIVKRLATSLGPIPHFFLTSEIDMERAAEAREALNKQLGDGGGGPKLSFNDIILKSAALALFKHRACNAWFQEDHIRYWNEVHLGMAVAVEDGLITPVIRNADQKSLTQISVEARELAGRARDRRLQTSEYTGATFSVSNLGMLDIDHFTAVINPPEAGILAVGAVVARPVADNGEVRVRRRMRVTMSCDHRVIDGATGASFLRTLKQMLENPLAMLL
jgi:pyruvate dehydrogenase E2 component (dihydrolipoamide acetyltransferase)